MIERTYFATYDLQPIADWFSANATEYFDRVEISEDKLSVTCYLGDLAAMVIAKSAETKGELSIKITAKGGYSTTIKAQNASESGTKTQTFIRRITKTSCGIAIALRGDHIHTSNNGADYSGNAADGFFITKDSNGDLAFVWSSLLMTGKGTLGASNSIYSTEEDIRSMNINSRTALPICGSTSVYSFGFIPMDYIQLTPIPIREQGTCYLPYCLISYYSNVLGTECTLEQNGTKYIYNGFVALKE